MTVPRWLPPVAVALGAGLLTWLNRGERAVVNLGIATFYRAPLALVLFLAFLAGMLSMLALSLRHDLRLRDELRARGLLAPVPSRGARPAVDGQATELHLPVRAEPEETLAFSADDPTARFQGDGAGEHHRFRPDGVPADDPTLIHRREPDPPLN